MNRHLAIFRSGPGSLHPQMTAGGTAQGFDYALSWFGTEQPPPEFRDNAVFVHRVVGAKWPGLLATLEEHWSTIASYEYVWLPDDDLVASPRTVVDLFAACEQLQLDVAQPALTPDSYYSWPITLQHTKFQARFTNYVEVMAPLFSRAMLPRVLPTLEGVVSGWGLDTVWPRLTTVGRAGIIDAAPVRHARQVGGPSREHSVAAGVSPLEEAMRTYARHGVDRRGSFMVNFGGLTTEGNGICLGGDGESLDRFVDLVLHSLAGATVPTTLLIRYLHNHIEYVDSGGHSVGLNEPYARTFLREELNARFAALGLAFDG